MLPCLLVPVLHATKSDTRQVSDSDRGSHQVFCHSGQALPLQHWLLLLLPPSPGFVKPDLNIVLGFVSWRMLTSPGPAPWREHHELSQSYAAPTPQDQDQGWEGGAEGVPIHCWPQQAEEPGGTALSPSTQASLYLVPHPASLPRHSSLKARKAVLNHGQRQGLLQKRASYIVQGEPQLRPLW